MLVAVDWHKDGWDISAALEELSLLAQTASLEVVGSMSQSLRHPHQAHYVGSGKLEELAALKEELSYSVVLVNDELSPSQLRNMEKELDVRVLDRTALILDIFAQHARTSEGRLQVELAQLEYRLPRLTRMWTHLSRQGVGGAGLRGPGETQLEVDRRESRRRITWIKEQLSEVHRHRQLYREQRQRQRMPVIALVGYTNAGKSTLLNRLADSDVIARDELFATLDPTTRRVDLPGSQTILMTDTVGFINNLPTQLVAAFRATLEEVLEATLLVHVLDVTHPNAFQQAQTVHSIIEDLGADDLPMITALNKVDRLGDDVSPEQLRENMGLSEHYVPISAHKGVGIDLLTDRIAGMLSEQGAFVDLQVLVPYTETQLVDLFHRRGHVDDAIYREDGTLISGRIPKNLAAHFEPYKTTSSIGESL
ncbi:MAG: GTPase HflX [Sphaerobacteraceae bacterium]|nr:MAG: GTPase HflX [Sphaerobacteraceae bacterium]